jgi:hypothetical protein
MSHYISHIKTAINNSQNNISKINQEILNLEGCMDPLALNYKSYFIKSKPSDCTFKKKRK